jgi:elongation factor G
MHDDELMEAALEGGEISQALIVRAIRKAALERKITPVFMGSAYKNKGVQPLLDAVTLYLPHPGEVENTALDLAADSAPVVLLADDTKPLVALAFKLEDGRFGQLTYMRIYQGSLQKSDTALNSRTGKKIKVGRLVRMHASQMEDIEMLHAGDIGAIFGVDCASGDTFTDPKLYYSMTSMHVPKPVISLSITPSDNKAQMQMSKAISRFVKEDPTFTSHVDTQTGETIIAGMGELHLDVYVERMRREYNAEVTIGRPQVAFRETITKRAEFDYTHRKQTGGAGQYAKVVGYIEPATEADFEFVNEVRGGTVPTQFIPACEKGFASSLQKGPLVGFPITGVRVVLNDGNSHAVDSSEMAFSAAARMSFRECYPKAGPVIMEPIMKVAVETPTEFQGPVMGSLNQRRGIIAGTMEEGAMTVIEADVPLSEMFGYATALRSLTQGKAQFTMEFAQYRKVPESVAVALKEKHREATGKD